MRNPDMIEVLELLTRVAQSNVDTNRTIIQTIEALTMRVLMLENNFKDLKLTVQQVDADNVMAAEGRN